MTEEVINELPEELKKHVCKLKKASKDDSNGEAMCESFLKVIHFDKISKEYSVKRGLRNLQSLMMPYILIFMGNGILLNLRMDQ